MIFTSFPNILVQQVLTEITILQFIGCSVCDFSNPIQVLFSGFPSFPVCSNKCFLSSSSLCYLKLQCRCSLPVSPGTQIPFPEQGGDKEKVIFHLTGHRLVLQLKPIAQIKKENIGAAESTPTFHRGNSSFVIQPQLQPQSECGNNCQA